MKGSKNVRGGLMDGSIALPRIGSVRQTLSVEVPFVILDASGVEIDCVSDYLKDLALSDQSPLTGRSYAYDLLRWFRTLWAVGIDWQQATSGEVAVLVGALRHGVNDQRRRSNPRSARPGSVNRKTGKATLNDGYAARTINHNLSVVSEFYRYQAHFGRGPVLNPVPSAAERRKALAHHSPIDERQRYSRAPLRQRVAKRKPTVIPDDLWDELFAAMTCDRDRALMLFYWTSGARAAEILGLTLADVDWSRSCVYVVSKGTRLREAVPVSAEALRYLLRYLDACGSRDSSAPLWLTQRGRPRPLSYSAFRRIFQRVNETLGTNWTLHDMRHSAATRMANDPTLSLPEVQAVLRHASITTTGEYLAVRVEDLVDRMQEHYARPRPKRSFAPGYDVDDIKVVFGD